MRRRNFIKTSLIASAIPTVAGFLYSESNSNRIKKTETFR